MFLISIIFLVFHYKNYQFRYINRIEFTSDLNLFTNYIRNVNQVFIKYNYEILINFYVEEKNINNLNLSEKKEDFKCDKITYGNENYRLCNVKNFILSNNKYKSNYYYDENYINLTNKNSNIFIFIELLWELKSENILIFNKVFILLGFLNIIFLFFNFILFNIK